MNVKEAALVSKMELYLLNQPHISRKEHAEQLLKEIYELLKEKFEKERRQDA